MEIKTKDNYYKDIHISQYVEIYGKDNHLSLDIPTRGSENITACLIDHEILYNCVIDYSLNTKAKDLLESTIQYLKKFPHIKSLKLHDSSYHDYKGAINNQLDLLSYSIAIYGRTWYEIHANAFSDNYERYRNEVEVYMSAKMSEWFVFFTTNIIGYSFDIVLKDEAIYEAMYNSSNTYPEFFQKLTNYRDPIFFRWWVNNFISSFINIPRYWYIPL